MADFKFAALTASGTPSGTPWWFGQFDVSAAVMVQESDTETVGTIFDAEDPRVIATGSLQLDWNTGTDQSIDQISSWANGYPIESHGQRKGTSTANGPVVTSVLGFHDATTVFDFILRYPVQWWASCWTRVLFEEH